MRKDTNNRRMTIRNARSSPASWVCPQLDQLEDRSVPAAFAAGNLVIYRVGDGGAGLSNTGAAVFLDEYTPAGAYVQSIALPTSISGANRQLIASGTATSEGALTRSADGQYIVLAGYARDLGGVGSLASTTAAAVNRTVGRVDVNGVVDTSTVLTDFADGNNPRSVASTNGSDLWVAGGVGGARYTTLGSTTSTQLSTTVVNLRQLNIFDGQLYTSTSSGGAVRVGTVGVGLPTTSGQTISNLPGFGVSGSPYGYFLADLDAGVAGVDTLYVASDDASALTKYSLVGGSWTSNGLIGAATDAYRGLTGVVNGTTVTLYATRRGGSAAAGGGEYVSIVDTSGFNGAFAGTPTLLATAATNTAFRGIALTPVSAGDVTPPTITSVEVVAPDPRNTSVATWDVTFSEPINAGLLDATDFTFQLGAGPNLLTGSEPVALVSGNTYRISGLPAQTTDGVYTLTISATGVQDLAGNPGVGSANDSFTRDATGPTITSVEVIAPDPRGTAVATWDVTFSELLDIASISAADFSLTFNAGANLLTSESVTFVSGTTYRISGLAGLTGAAGNYVVSISATGVTDALGNAGTGNANDSWTFAPVDNTAPTITGIFFAGSAWGTPFRTAAGDALFGFPGQTGANQLASLPWNNLNEIVVTFSEPVAAPAGLASGQVGVRGTNGGTYAITSVTAVDPQTWRILLTTAPDTDWLIVDLDGDGGGGATRIEDLAGNDLAGTFTESVSTFPTTGAAGVDFKYRFKVVVGDQGRNGTVRNVDLNAVRNNLFIDIGAGGYDIFTDIDANGLLRNADLNAVRNHLFIDAPGVGPTRPNGGSRARGSVAGSTPNRAAGFQATASAATERSTLVAARRLAGQPQQAALDALFADLVA